MEEKRKRFVTDSISCPMPIIWGEGTDDNEGILGLKRKGSKTGASLVTSSSIKEFVGMSCKGIIKKDINYNFLYDIILPLQVHYSSNVNFELACKTRNIPHQRIGILWNGKPFDYDQSPKQIVDQT